MLVTLVMRGADSAPRHRCLAATAGYPQLMSVRDERESDNRPAQLTR
jgi:hypothetical protein